MDVTHYSSFGKQKNLRVTIDTYSKYIMATPLPGEKTKHAIQHCLNYFLVMGVLHEIKTDNGPAYTSHQFKDFCAKYSIKHFTGIPYNPQGQGIIERAHQELKGLLQKQRGEQTSSAPTVQVSKALFTLSFLTFTTLQGEEGPTSSVVHHWGTLVPQTPHPLVQWKDPLTGQVRGPDPLLMNGQGYACVFPENEPQLIWIPSRLIRPWKP
jgi:transposase InsO family protein